MVRRLTILVVALLVLGATVAGCGSDNKSSDNSGDNSSKSSDSGGSSGGSGGSANPQSKQAVAQCKQSVSQAPNLSSSVKSDLDGICEKAGRGDEQAVRKATKEVCVKIVKESVPAGAAQKQATDACNKAGGGKSGGASGY